jgi:hypothetical protein
MGGSSFFIWIVVDSYGWRVQNSWCSLLLDDFVQFFIIIVICRCANYFDRRIQFLVWWILKGWRMLNKLWMLFCCSCFLLAVDLQLSIKVFGTDRLRAVGRPLYKTYNLRTAVCRPYNAKLLHCQLINLILKNSPTYFTTWILPSLTLESHTIPKIHQIHKICLLT